MLYSYSGGVAHNLVELTVYVNEQLQYIMIIHALIKALDS